MTGRVTQVFLMVWAATITGWFGAAYGQDPSARGIAEDPPRRDAPLVAEIVNSISKAQLELHVQELEGIRRTAEQRAIARSYIVSELEKYGYEVELQSISSPPGQNVIARLEGRSASNDILVVGAHFDTVSKSPGADDNASGVAGTLEAARVLAESDPALTIEFVAFDLEEGTNLLLPGSRAYVSNLVRTGKNVVGMFNLEMIGYTCADCQDVKSTEDKLPCLDVTPEKITSGDWIAVIADKASPTLLSSFMLSAGKYAMPLGVVSGVSGDQNSCFEFASNSKDEDAARHFASDHWAFWEAGFPALLITDTAEKRNPNYHLSTDTFDTLDFEFMTGVVQATVATVANLAGCAEPVYAIAQSADSEIADSFWNGAEREASLGEVTVRVPRTNKRFVTAAAVSNGLVAIEEPLRSSSGQDLGHLLAFRGVNESTGEAALYVAVLGQPDSWMPIEFEGVIRPTGTLTFSPDGSKIWVDTNGIDPFQKTTRPRSRRTEDLKSISLSYAEVGGGALVIGAYTLTVGARALESTEPASVVSNVLAAASAALHGERISVANPIVPQDMIIANFSDDVKVRDPNIAPNGDSVLFSAETDDEGEVSSSVYVIRDLLSLLASGDRGDTFAKEGYGSLDDPRIVEIHARETGESSNALWGFFSHDGEKILFSESSKRISSASNYSTLSSNDVKLYMSDAKGKALHGRGMVEDSRETLRFTGPAPQRLLTGIIPGASQILSLKPSGSESPPRLYRETLVSIASIFGRNIPVGFRAIDTNRDPIVIDGEPFVANDSTIQIDAPVMITDPLDKNTSITFPTETMFMFPRATRDAGRFVFLSSPVTAADEVRVDADGNGTIDDEEGKDFDVLGGVAVGVAHTQLSRPAKVSIALSPATLRTTTGAQGERINDQQHVTVLQHRGNRIYLPISSPVTIDYGASPPTVSFEIHSVPTAAVSPRAPADATANLLVILGAR